MTTATEWHRIARGVEDELDMLDIDNTPPDPMKYRNKDHVNWNSPTNARNDFAARYANALFLNEWKSDISFHVSMENRTFPAHALIVAFASPVLERHCFPRKGERRNTNMFTLPYDCSADDFVIVLRYLYTGDAMEQLNVGNAAAVLKIAIFLDLRQLQIQCEQLIERELSVENVCSIFETIHLLDIEINEICLQFMQDNAQEILENGTAMQMSDEPLRKLLSQDLLNIDKEIQLVAPMVTWADAECRSWLISSSGANRRLVLGSRLYLIRFAAMANDEFLESIQILGDKCLEDYEVSSTSLHITSQNQSEPVISTNPWFSDVKRTPSWIDCVIDTAEEGEWLFVSDSSSRLDLDVSQVKGKFILAGIQIYDHRASITIRNIFTNTGIAFSSESESDSLKCMFAVGVTPIKGKIALRITSANHQMGYATNRVPIKNVKIHNDFSCVSRIFVKTSCTRAFD